MAAPPQGMGGPSDEDRRREKRHHTEVLRLGLISIIVAIIIGVPVIFLGIQTSFVLDEIKSISAREYEAEHFEPIFEPIRHGFIDVFPYNRTFSLVITYSDTIGIDFISDHYFSFALQNSTFYYYESCGDQIFDSIPKFEQVHWVPDYEVGNHDTALLVFFEMDLEFDPFLGFLQYYGDHDGSIRVGKIIFDIIGRDLQTGDSYYLNATRIIVVDLPKEYYTKSEECEKQAYT